MGFLKGKSKSTSTNTSSSNSVQASNNGSFNRALPQLNQSLTPLVEQSTQGNSFIQNLLGVNSDASPQDAFRGFLDNSGYAMARDDALGGLQNNRALRGLLNSGGTLKAYSQTSQDLMNQYFNQYIANVSGTRDSGLSAAQILSGAGQTSFGNSSSVSNSQSQGSSESTQSPGFAGLIGAGASAYAASDRRLKENIEKIGELENGLGLYSYTYTFDPEKTPKKGVMADEVAEIIPEALGPVVGGYATVDYSKLPEIN